MSQIALPLDWPADPRDDEFLIGSSNIRAVQLLERWSTWPVMAVILCGPRKSGRSLVARIFAAKSGGQIIDDAERQQETAVFHAWNHAQEIRRPLIMVADAPPPEWKVKLPDLRSRLSASPIAKIDMPDEALMGAILERQFLRRGLDARPELIHWLVARIERNHVALLQTVDLLDQAVMERRKRLSIPLARATLGDPGMIVSRPAEPSLDL